MAGKKYLAGIEPSRASGNQNRLETPRQDSVAAEKSEAGKKCLAGCQSFSAT